MAQQSYESGPLPVVEAAREDSRYAPASMWAMPVDRGAPAEKDTPAQEPAPQPPPPDPDTGFADDEDAIETTPIPVEADADPDEDEAGENGDAETTRMETEPVASGAPALAFARVPADYDERDDEPPSGPSSGRHAAVQLQENTATRTAFRIASDDGYNAPDGYPIKADTKSGLYWSPESARYAHVRAEIWFSSEEFALTNGFEKG